VPKDVPTIWVDQTSGQGVTQDGASVRPRIGDRRKNPNLTDLLETAASYGASRIMLTGKRPDPSPDVRHWLLVQTPNWTPGSHWLKKGPLTGRFTHAKTGFYIEVRTVEEWFGDLKLNPAQARMAWDQTAAALRAADDRARLMLSPAMTGLNFWALSLPRNVNPVPLTADIADELHFTGGQHHIEHTVAGPNRPDFDTLRPLIDPAKTKKIDSFAYIDGRFMYAGLCSELGIGPGYRLNRTKAFQLLESEPYARARYYVRFQVPKDWNHVGILGVKHEELSDGWFYPNAPGATGETWADASEILVARKNGWMIDPLEAVAFNIHTNGRKADGSTGRVRARPLDTFAERMNRARERVSENPELDPLLIKAVETALRQIMLSTIGSFGSRGRDVTRIVENAWEIPPNVKHVRQGKYFIFDMPGEVSDRNRSFYHPEFTAQIWGLARARLLDSPSALGRNTAGALTIDPTTLIGLNGDAIYTTSLPDWALPTSHGGGDDGKTSRLRLKGYIRGSFTTPATRAQRDSLRTRSEKAGLSELEGANA
jgi:hypothetical protein